MIILGYNKTTLLDYPGRVAATVFTGGCNFRCPFCHNKDLLDANISMNAIDEEYVFEHLKKRRNVLNGVCITGGEPTLQKDLEEFIHKIRNIGYEVKLDTNGSNPEVLKKLLDEKLINYVAMDIKNTYEKYAITAGTESHYIGKIRESIDILLSCEVDYEFRTTIVKELHVKEDIINITKMIKGARKYFLQGYVESPNVLEKRFSAYTRDELTDIIKDIKDINIMVRGID